MKLLYCLKCGDMRALDPKCAPVSCRCGTCHARWTDPRRGLAIYSEDEYGYCRMLGIHNGVLGQRPMYQAWRDADGYLFQREESMIINTRPGYSSDTRLTGREEVYASG